jgi:MFS family permease
MSPKRPWFVLGILCIGFFMALLDGSIVTIAIPTLIGSIHASYDQVLWIIDAYLLVFSVLLITTGRLGDILGYKRLFVAGVATFTVASALCGLSGSPAQLLAARVLQGVGAAILFPQVISTILTVFPPQLRGRAFGVFGAIVGFAPVVGPIVGGFVLAHLGWRWIFLVNLPIGVLTVILAAVFVPDLRRSGGTASTSQAWGSPPRGWAASSSVSSRASASAGGRPSRRASSPGSCSSPCSSAGNTSSVASR